MLCLFAAYPPKKKQLDSTKSKTKNRKSIPFNLIVIDVDICLFPSISKISVLITNYASVILLHRWLKGGKKNRQKERRLMKGFNLASVGVGAGGGSQSGLACSTPSLAGSSMIPTSAAACSRASMQTLNETAIQGGVKSSNPLLRSPMTKLAQLARLAGAKKTDSKKKWGNLIEAAKSARGVGRMWARSRSRSEDSGKFVHRIIDRRRY